MVPPLVDVAEVVELAPLVVEAVRDLVPDDDANAAVVERLREVLVVERRLQDASGEHWNYSLSDSHDHSCAVPVLLTLLSEIFFPPKRTFFHCFAKAVS